jgi:hypothetical protein
MRLRSTLPKGDMGFILGLMDELEADKATLGDLDDAGVQLENFGQELFLRADDADRAGQSDLRTGKAFLAAAQVREALRRVCSSVSRPPLLPFPRGIPHGRPLPPPLSGIPYHPPISVSPSAAPLPPTGARVLQAVRRVAR